MRVLIGDELEVLWPYDFLYPEQFQYMQRLYQALQSGHCLLEMPTGTGKTVSLLSLILAYQYHKQGGKGKLIYCTRTVQEMDKVVEELRRVMDYREKTILEQVKVQVRRNTAQEGREEHKGQAQQRMEVDGTTEEEGQMGGASGAVPPLSVRDPRILGVCLSSRRNLCIHSEVSSFDNRNKVDALCVCEGSLVALGNGTSVPIEEVQVGVEVLSYYAALVEGETEGLTVRQVKAVLDQGIKECVELLFSDGRTLVCTPDHRIRTADGRWVPAGDLTVGTDEVAVGVECPIQSRGGEGGVRWRLDTRKSLGYNLDMAERAQQSLAFARLLGYLLTDGCTSDHFHKGARVLPLFRARLVGRQNVGMKHVYDLSVPSPEGDETQSFVANGILVHNCRNLTASFIREQHAQGSGVPICEFYEGYEREGKESSLLGVYSLADLKVLGREKGWCPYFYARYAISLANVVVYNYQYMLDPKISGLVSRDMEKESIVVFDEAHNIDNIAIEALSVQLDGRTVNAAAGNLSSLTRAVKAMEKTDAQRLQQEYNHLLRGLTGGVGGAHSAAQAGEASSDVKEDDSSSSSSSSSLSFPSAAADRLLASPVLPSDVLREAVPGNIRRAKHFLLFLRSWVEFIKQRLLLPQVSQETPTAFLADLQKATLLTDTKALRFAFDRLQTLFQTLKLTDLDDYTPLSLLTTFATVVSTYNEGFMVIFEPFDERNPAIPDPRLELCCLDASLAMKPVFERFHSVVITSGTLSPLDVYPKVLNFQPSVVESFSMSLSRNVICPLIVTKGSDQVPITSKFDLRSDVSVIQNYGRLLVDLCSVVPDGVVGFFTSYRYMEDIVAAWKELGIIDQLLALKLIFIETKDIVETTLALDAYKRACSCGRGALFLSVARGKVAEGIDFDRHFGRCVVIFGIPFQYTLSRVLRCRLEYLRTHFQLSEADFLSFDALRQTAQCVGRVIRSKTDYGLMIFADARFNRVDKRNKLPKWITQFMDKAHLNLSTDRALTIAREFLKSMAQPRSQSDELGITMLNEQQVQQRVQQLRRQQQMEAAQNGGGGSEAVAISVSRTSSAITSSASTARRM